MLQFSLDFANFRLGFFVCVFVLFFNSLWKGLKREKEHTFITVF